MVQFSASPGITTKLFSLSCRRSSVRRTPAAAAQPGVSWYSACRYAAMERLVIAFCSYTGSGLNSGASGQLVPGGTCAGQVNGTPPVSWSNWLTAARNCGEAGACTDGAPPLSRNQYSPPTQSRRSLSALSFSCSSALFWFEVLNSVVSASGSGEASTSSAVLASR